jgi:hypothetical protein
VDRRTAGLAASAIGTSILLPFLVLALSGPLIGPYGANEQIVEDALTNTLYAMLHADTWTEGTYEFPGADPPVTVDGNVVVKPLSTSALLPETGGVLTPSTAISLMAGGTLALAAEILIRRLNAMRSEQVTK